MSKEKEIIKQIESSCLIPGCINTYTSGQLCSSCKKCIATVTLTCKIEGCEEECKVRKYSISDPKIYSD